MSSSTNVPESRRTSWIDKDGWRVIAARSVRNFGYGFTSVLLGVTLTSAGFSTLDVGLLLTVALLGDMLAIILVAIFADRIGRRRVLMFFALLMSVSGVVFALSHSLLLLLLAAFFGTISPSNSENTPFSAIEQALLPQTCPEERRADIFARYNLGAQLAGALGGLAVVIPDILHQSMNMSMEVALRFMFGGYALLALAVATIFLTMSNKVESTYHPVKQTPTPSNDAVGAQFIAPAAPLALAASKRRVPLQQSRSIVLRLSALFAVDAFAGGLVVQAILSLWFHQRFGVPLSMLGLLFFGTNLLSALSLPVAAWLAKRIGLLNTMVFTHLPSNILLMCVAFMPVFPLAALFLLARQMLSQMDVPTRQAYTMTLVDPEERTAAASATTIARSIALSLSPVLSGLLISGTALTLGLPFLIGGSLKAVYDLTLYGVFKKVKVP
jgi:MFS family permease